MVVARSDQAESTGLEGALPTSGKMDIAIMVIMDHNGS